MLNDNILLFELGTEELPISILENINLNLYKYLFFEFKKNRFIFSNIKVFITLRRISFLVYNLSYYQNIKLKYFNKKIYLNKKKYLKKIDNYKNNNNNKNIEELLINILNSVFLKLIKNNKVMRWGINNNLFFRPIINLLVMLNNKFLNIELFGVKSNNLLLGNKFTKKKYINIKNINNYIYLLKENNIYIIYKDRKNIIINSINKILYKNNFISNNLNNFINKVSWMVEYPVVLLCNFDYNFLSLPKDIVIFIISKYFCLPLYKTNNELINYFIVIINIKLNNYNNIILNYKKIIELELKEVKYLYLKDIKYPLISYLSKLNNIIFHKNLGTYLQKITRMLYLSKNILSNLFFLNLDINIIYKCLLLIKCDLVTFLGINFKQLKGLIGMNYYYYHCNDSLISNIIRDHYYSYKNINIYSILVSLIDKFDTFIGISIVENFCFLKKSNDPYGLKKISLLIIKILFNNNLYINIYIFIKNSLYLFKNKYFYVRKNIFLILNFIKNRFINYLLKLNYSKYIILSIINNNYYIKKFDFLDIKKRIEFILKIKNNLIFIKFINIYKRLKNILLKLNILKINIYININLLKKKEEIILFNYLIKLKKKYYLYLKFRKYNRLIKIFFISIKKIENFLNLLKINDKNILIKRNRIFLIKKIYNIFNRFIDFSYYY